MYMSLERLHCIRMPTIKGPSDNSQVWVCRHQVVGEIPLLGGAVEYHDL